MNTLFALIGVQALLGAVDNLWHHEWTERLPARKSARTELRLHAARESPYAIVFVPAKALRPDSSSSIAQCKTLYALYTHQGKRSETSSRSTITIM